MAPLHELYRVDHRAFAKWVADTYGIGVGAHQQSLNQHRLRRETMSRRLRLYRDQGSLDVCRLIDSLYTTDYKDELKKFVPIAMGQNVTRRINDETASLYDRPALRILKDRDEEFHKEERRLNLHELAQETHHLVNLCNEVLEWQFKGIGALTKLRIVTPDMFDAIPHPEDKLEPAGFLIDMPPTTALTGPERARLPHYEVWDDTYRYLLSADGLMVDREGKFISVPEEHGLSRIPGVLLHRREPVETILDDKHGADIESAHLGASFLNCLIMRLSKSQGERQPVLQGNLAAFAQGQSANGERPLLLPPEVTASVLDTRTDAEHYLQVKKDLIASVAQTYGMSYEQFTLSETTIASGKEYQARREKLTEIRLEKRRRAVIHEAQTVELMGFESEGMRVDYAEQSIPADAMEELELLDKKMRMGLDSPVAYVQRKDPDKDRKEAIAFISENLADFARLVTAVRALNIPGDADAGNPGQSPQENGGNNDSAPKNGANPTPGNRRQPPREREATAA